MPDRLRMDAMRGILLTFVSAVLRASFLTLMYRQ